MGWLPFLGETLAFLKPHKSNSLGSFLQKRCFRYGKVFKSHLFGSPAIVSCDLELNMFILQNEDKLFQTSYPKAIHGILGKYSLLLVSGDLHKKLRNVIVGFISSSKSKSNFLQCVEKLLISMFESWNDREQVSFFKEAKTARERLASTVKDLMKERAALKGEAGLTDDGHEEELEEDEEEFLDAILAKENLNEEEKMSIVLDILLGGYETTATLMALIVYFIGHAPHVFQRLKEEHQSIRESKKGKEPLNWEDYKKMEFTYHVTCEAMRCGNVVKFVHRKALQDVKFKEIFIPSGWKVLPIFTGVHFDQSLHEKPLEFNPWRWTDKEMRKKVTPFGGGPRLCPGAELAKVVIGFFLHHLVLKYRWKIKTDDLPLAYPYVEFRRGLILEIEPAEDTIE
ncbi:Cytochrome P450 [Morus notabilis]|uniref:Cytochrome P450 n=1 Tax=Morus notabilis TaxID=981085 RepID=W9S8K0_9ROSA|nr:Cytochrome P450 [Morus notabilis]